MYIDRPALKREARQAMRAARPSPMLVTLLYLLLTAGLSTLISIILSDPIVRIMELTQQGLSPAQAIPVVLSAMDATGLFLHILVAAFSLVMSFGYSRWSLNAARGEKASVSDLVSGFSMAGRVLWLNVLILVYGLILELVFAMAARLAMLVFIWVPFLNFVALFVLSITAAVVPQLLMLHYTMSTYCMLDDPELSAFASMRRSRQLMRGRIGNLLLLYLSFIGWFLLAVALTVAAVLCCAGPIGYALATPDASINAFIYCMVPAAVSLLCLLLLSLWLTPYLAIAECKFYDRLPRTQSDAPPFDL